MYVQKHGWIEHKFGNRHPASNHRSIALQFMGPYCMGNRCSASISLQFSNSAVTKRFCILPVIARRCHHSQSICHALIVRLNFVNCTMHIRVHVRISTRAEILGTIMGVGVNLTPDLFTASYGRLVASYVGSIASYAT
jgi:hypothetical protein